MSQAAGRSEDDQYSYVLSPSRPLNGVVPIDETFYLNTEDSSGGQIKEGVLASELRPEHLFPVTGPMHVEGVCAGDMVRIEIVNVELGAYAHTWTRPGLGLKRWNELVVHKLDSRRLEVFSQSSGQAEILIAKAELRPHVGAIGLLPEREEAPRTLGSHGGNLDFTELGAGSSIWLRATVDGGGLFVGDVHAAMGDGEICGTGAESSARVGLRCRIDNSVNARLPIVEAADGSIWVIGIGHSFEDALENGVDYCIDRISRGKGITVDDAYLAIGLLLRIRVCQIVNPKVSVALSLGGQLDEFLR